LLWMLTNLWKLNDGKFSFEKCIYILLIVVLPQALIGWSKFQIRKKSPSWDLRNKGNIIGSHWKTWVLSITRGLAWPNYGRDEVSSWYLKLNVNIGSLALIISFEMLFATICMLYHCLSPRIQINVIWMPGIHTFYKVITILNSFLHGNHITPWLLILFFKQFLGCNVNCECG
jgi:hypothetical protein